MSDKVIKLSEVATSSDTWTTEDLLVVELEKAINGERPKKCVCIFLDDTNKSYGIGYGSAGFHKASEIVALLECLKLQIISHEMNLL